MFQTHGKWIVPDVGYIDFGTGNYRELFFGAGRTLYDGKKLMMTEELYFVQPPVQLLRVRAIFGRGRSCKFT